MGAEGGVGKGTSGTGGARAELERRRLPLGSWKGSWSGAGNMSLKGELEWAVGTGNWRGTWRGQLEELEP